MPSAGVCNLCNGAVNFMLDHDTEGRFRMAALQSEAGRTLLESCGRRSDDISSIVLVEPDGHYIKSCARFSSQPWHALSFDLSYLISVPPTYDAAQHSIGVVQGGCSAHCQRARAADAGT